MKTKEQLLEEIDGLQRKVDKLKKSASENRRIIKILRDSEQEKMAILDAMFECVTLLDSNLKVIWSNRTASQRFGLSQEQVQGMHCYSLFAGKNHPCNRPICPAQKALDTGKVVEVSDLHFLGSRWAVRHYPLKGGEKIVSVATDIAEQKAAVEALQREQAQKDIILADLKQSEDKYKTLFDDSRDAVFIMNVEGRIIEANQACLDLFGITKQDLALLNVWDFVFASERKHKFIYAIEGKKAVVDYPARMKKKNGEAIDCLLTASLKYGHDGGILGYQGIIRDITEKKKLEKEVLEISERERWEMGLELHDGLGQLLTGIALKSKSIAQTLSKISPAEAGDVQKLTDLANEAIGKARQMIKGLVLASNGEGGFLDSLAELAVATRNTHGISCAVHSNCPQIDFDDITMTQLYRIVQEAIINAVKHGKASKISINMDKVDDEVTLSIKDNGIGFSFQKSSCEGRGLRIMAYRARMVDGALNIHKNKESGMTVICTLRDKKSDHEYDVMERMSQKLLSTSR
jgi:two-component system sensor kinase FixL